MDHKLENQMVFSKDSLKAVMIEHWMVYRLVHKSAQTMVVLLDNLMVQTMELQTVCQLVY